MIANRVDSAADNLGNLIATEINKLGNTIRSETEAIWNHITAEFQGVAAAMDAMANRPVNQVQDIEEGQILPFPGTPESPQHLIPNNFMEMNADTQDAAPHIDMPVPVAAEQEVYNYPHHPHHTANMQDGDQPLAAHDITASTTAALGSAKPIMPKYVAGQNRP
jgi:hypothetical protein